MIPIADLLLALILMIHLSVDIHDNKHDYLKKKSLKLSLHIVLFVQVGTYLLGPDSTSILK